ncbi:hypothetical protein QOZ80_2BG0196030 [Eleusine coracana subsp. coracana]|nr:hypothetical protein QOZ80_2BG0196030 [Eleusine coracana subsp. coracana]
MEDERNTQYSQGADETPAEQVEVKERGFLNTLLGRKKAPEDQGEEKKQEAALVSGMDNVKVSEPEKHHDEGNKEEHHEGGEKKESLFAKLHRTSSSSSSSSDEEEEEVIDENGEIVKRKKKKGLKEKIKEKLPGHKDHPDVVEGEHKPYAPTPVPTHAHHEPEHKPYVPAPPTPVPTYVHQEAEHKPYVAPPAVQTHAYKEDNDHKAYIPATAPPTTTPVTTAHVHHDDNATVVQKVEETPEKGLLDKIKEKLPGGHKKPEDAAAAPATHGREQPRWEGEEAGPAGQDHGQDPWIQQGPGRGGAQVCHRCWRAQDRQLLSVPRGFAGTLITSVSCLFGSALL